MDETPVQTVLNLNELIMRSLLDSLSFVDDDDIVSIENCGQPMCDDDSRSVFCNAIESRLYDSLARYIKCAGGFVENENLGLTSNSSSDRDPLTLPSAEMQASFTYKSVIALCRLAYTK